MATREEIAAKNDSLAISLYAHVAAGMPTEDVSLADSLINFALSSEELNATLKTLSDAMSKGVVAEISSRPPRPEVAMPSFVTSKVKLGEVAEEVRGNWRGDTTDVPIVGLEHLDPDEIWLKRWEVNPDENTFTKAFRKGQILLGRRRVYQKKLSVAPCDGICSGDITVIAAKGDMILPELLPFYLRSERFFDYAMQGSAGSLSPRVKWAHLADYEFDLPPIEKQRELAELLWAANDLKESYKKLIVAADEMLKAKFREMFGECGSWERKKLKDLLVIERGGSPRPIAKFMTEDPNGINWIKIGDVAVGDKYITQTAERIIPDGEKMSRRVYPGDFLLSNSMSFGRPYILKIEGCIHDGWLVLRDTNNVFDQEYLYYLLGSDEAKHFFETQASGSTVKNLNKDLVGAFVVAVPPLALQQEFVEIARKADETKAALKKSIADVDNVIKGLING